MGKPPNHPFVHRVFHYFHHPFWVALIFGNIHINPNFFGGGENSTKIFEVSPFHEVYDKGSLILKFSRLFTARVLSLLVVPLFVGWFAGNGSAAGWFAFAAYKTQQNCRRNVEKSFFFCFLKVCSQVVKTGN